MVKSLGRSIINMYSMGACAALGITNQDALSEDLENDPFLNSALQRFTCELYYRFGSFLAPLSVGIITSRHYLWGRAVTPGPHLNAIKMEEQVEAMKAPQPPSRAETTKNLLTSSKSEVIGYFLGMGIVGFWFGIGFMLAVKTVNNLEEFIRR